MNYESITDIINEPEQSSSPLAVLSVSENGVDIVPEAAPPDEVESEVPVETPVETVSGNGVPSDSSADVSGNSVFVPYDDSGVTAGIDGLQQEIKVLHNDMAALQEQMKEASTTLFVISTLLSALFFFTVFKWCEQKIKRFTKGVFQKYE